MERSREPFLAWFGHPATVVATFVLLINDHLLKTLWPGPVTGKLSDVAGLLVAPPLLALAISLAFLRTGSLSPDPTRFAALAAIVTVGVGFTLVKTTEAGAELASRAWTLAAGPSRVLADPTDLVALPALGAAWLIWRRCRTGHPVRRVRALIIVPIALVGVTATSAVPSPPAAKQVFVSGGTITVVLDQGAEILSPHMDRLSRTGQGYPKPLALPELGLPGNHTRAGDPGLPARRALALLPRPPAPAGRGRVP
ncbi:hypothetical protein OG339_42975 [Streptosporangium sp. NBC_01495]|uniref:hypothetical protein n=1 Tax=Streptosporangium sp. NBC_01495 TaxID=2903899 RepID=UPI002E36904F|nr:hypothetical protein [Streptosporangium sp. NBC_01495]